MKTFEDWKTFLDEQSLGRADHSRILKVYKGESTHPVVTGSDEHLWRMLRSVESDEDKAVVQAFLDA